MIVNEGGKLLGRSAAIRSVLADLERLLPSLAPGHRAPPILLQGETGTGKGLLARTIHDASPRAGGPFIDLNCAAIPATLLEAELFGFERGAFTDAHQSRTGLVEAAHTGTLFLDEIALLPESLQSKLLTVLEAREVRRLGRTRSQPVDILIVTATNSDLRAAVRQGRFREDLYHRLAVFVFSLPPLRDRGADVLDLAEAFLARACADHGLPAKTLSADAREALGAYRWPGNVRELANLLERAALLNPEQTITAGHLAFPASPDADETSPEGETRSPLKLSVATFARQRLEDALTQAHGNVAAAAEQLGVARSTLRYQLEKLGLAAGRNRAPGAPAATRTRTRPAEPPPRPLAERLLSSSEGERKQVTVLLAHLDTSMELLADVPPDDSQRRLDVARQRMVDAVQRYGGAVTQVRADGLMALFGAPLAQEDHAVRACSAALSMHEAIAADVAGPGSRRADVQIRIGLHSGDVVVRAIGGDLRLDYSAVPDTTHVAARVEQLAPPGTTRLTAETWQLAEGFVEVAEVPGPAASVAVYELRGLAAAHSRLAVAMSRGLTRFVGREAEMAMLRALSDRVRHGAGQVVAIVAEPGVGKSRLTWEVTTALRRDGWLVLETGTATSGKAAPYLPLADLLRAYFEVDARDESGRVREKVAARLEGLDGALRPLQAPLLALLDVPVDDAEWVRRDPRERRLLTLDAARRVLLRESEAQPIAVAVDDLQWIDSETQAFLDRLAESLPAARVLLLVNYRPEGEHAWNRKTYYTQVRLDPLAEPSAGELLDALVGGEGTLATLRALLIARTEGNPFFIEESVRALVETGALVGAPGAYRPGSTDAAVRVPARVESLLAARIDRLAPHHKRLLQIASVIGKDVPWALLRLIDDRSEDDTRQGLDALQSAEFLYERQLYPELAYTFKHALTHEVAYRSLLEGARRQHHERMATALEEKFPATCEGQPELLAHHFTGAGLAERAADYWLRAVQRATRRWVYPEAVRYASQGLEVLRTMPEGDERDRRELALQLALISPLQASRGWSAAELEPVLRRCQDLCDRVGDPRQLESLLRGQMVFYLSVDLARARDLGERHLALVQRSGRSPIYSHAMLAHILRNMGRFEDALAHADAGIEVYDPTKDNPRINGQLVDGRVGCLSDAANALWSLGFPEQAWRRLQDMLDHARSLDSPFSLSWALLNVSRHLRVSREDDRSGGWLEEGVRIAREYGFTWLLGWGTIERGWELVRSGRADEGLTLFREGLDLLQAQGTKIGQSINFAFLAEAYGLAGDPRRGLGVLDEALRFVEGVGERYFESGLRRVRGELLQALGSETEAEASMLRALDVARAQHARAFELRVALSLARLWQRRQRTKDARELVAEVHGRFTEGLDTLDSREARALLEELSD